MPLDLDLHPTVSESDDDSGYRTVLSGRFRLRGAIGAGGAGEVFLAEDLRAGGVVAVKLSRLRGPQQEARWRREVSALRILDLPGVVRLVDAGVEDDTRIIAMEHVEGRPFPGRLGPCTWDDIAFSTLRLVETLGQVHEIGVLHRDLKPSNVLVRADGEPVVLDFGLARGDALGETFTQTGAVMGTPAYWPPEQLVGKPVDSRADLYSLGVMLYEALAGEIPDRAEPLRRLTSPFPPLHTAATGAPWAVCAVIDRLVAPEPDRRFDSAFEVLAALETSPHAQVSVRALPRLGPRGPLEELTAALREGRSADVVGASGTGRTRLVRDALIAAERPAVWLRSSAEAFGSLAPVLGEVLQAPENASLSLAEVNALVASGLARVIGDRTILVADPWESTDAFSQRALTEAGKRGGLVRICASPSGDSAAAPVIPTAPLEHADLALLFAGPDRLLHLREDAASLLLERSRGVPAVVEAELRSWIRKGLAAWRGELVAVTRGALNRLRTMGQAPPPRSASMTRPELSSDDEELLSWVQLAGDHAVTDVLRRALNVAGWQLEARLEALTARGTVARLESGVYRALLPSLAHLTWSPQRVQDAHTRLAECVPRASTARVVHRVLAGEPNALVADAIEAAAALEGDGRHGDGAAILQAAWEATSEAPTALRTRILTHWALIVLRTQQSAGFEVVRAAIGKLGADDGIEPDLHALLEGAALVAAGRDAEGRAVLDGVGARDDLAWETCRSIWLIQAYRRAPIAEEAALLKRVEETTARLGDADLAARLAGWRGLHLYRLGRYQEAAREHLTAAAGRRDALGSLSSRANAASALLEAGDLARAEEIAERVGGDAAAVRDPHYEGRALWLARSARYRRGAELEPDPEAIEAAKILSLPHLEASLALLDAAIHWRNGAREPGLPVALQATAAYDRIGSADGAALGRALAIALGAPEEPGCDDVLAVIERTALLGIAAQALALLPSQARGIAPERRALLLASLRTDRAEQRLEVLSPREIRAALA